MISMNNTTYKAPVVKIVTVHANNLICSSPLFLSSYNSEYGGDDDA